MHTKATGWELGGREKVPRAKKKQLSMQAKEPRMGLGSELQQAQNPRKLSCNCVSIDDLASNTHTAISLSICFPDD